MKKLLSLLFIGCLISFGSLGAMEGQNVKEDVSEGLEEKAQDDWELRCIQEEEYRLAEEDNRNDQAEANIWTNARILGGGTIPRRAGLWFPLSRENIDENREN